MSRNKEATLENKEKEIGGHLKEPRVGVWEKKRRDVRKSLFSSTNNSGLDCCPGDSLHIKESTKVCCFSEGPSPQTINNNIWFGLLCLDRGEQEG